MSVLMQGAASAASDISETACDAKPVLRAGPAAARSQSTKSGERRGPSSSYYSSGVVRISNLFLLGKRVLDPNKATLPDCKQTAIWVGFFFFIFLNENEIFYFQSQKITQFHCFNFEGPSL